MQTAVTLKESSGVDSRFIDEVFSFELSDFRSISRLKDKIHAEKPGIALNRPKLLVDYFEKHGFDLEKPILRQAESLKYILSNMPAAIFDEEIIVGSTTEHRLGCLMFPEFQANVIWPDLFKAQTRKMQPLHISDEAIAEFSFRIFPYFKDKNIGEWTKKRFGYKHSLKLMERMIFYLVAHPVGVSHLIPDYTVAMRDGFDKVKETARNHAAKIAGDDAKAESKRMFYQALELVSDGVINFAKTHSAKCSELAAKEKDSARKADLEEIARILAKVPAKPAETFREALQSIWITHVALMQENSDMALSFGRMDQFLLPYYRRDIASGELNPKKALELIMAFYVKTNDHTPPMPTSGQALFAGAANNQSVTMSGILPDGTDGTNELSFLFLRAIDLLKMREPNVDARFHPGSPKIWFEKVLEVVKSTGATPALYNDEAVVKSLVAKGLKLEDARDYGVIGCVETAVQGKCYPMTGAILLNMAAALELAINGGKHPLSGLQIGPKTLALRDVKSYDEFRGVFYKQLENLIDESVDAEILYDRAHEELHPVPLMSALIEGAMDKGADVTSGSATYNSSGVWVVGLPDVTDSLAALKKLVFDEKRISASEMQEALTKNFAGFDRALAMCKNRAPKYGNDDPEADDVAVDIVRETDRLFNKRPNYRGGPYYIGYWSITFHTGYGKLTGALPSGRLKGEALSSGATPVSGCAKNGASASLSSTAKLPPECLTNCIANNHKIPLALLDENGKMEILEQLVKSYFDKGGMQLQFVIANKKTLVEAMENKEIAASLLVRVSGYTAYFGDLDRAMQMEIIDRTEDSI